MLLIFIVENVTHLKERRTKMGIEQDISEIKNALVLLAPVLQEMDTRLKDLNEKVDLLTIRKQVDRHDKEKRIKDTLPPLFDDEKKDS